jgi:hypothetical protein
MVAMYCSQKEDTYQPSINYLNSANIQVKVTAVMDKYIRCTFSGMRTTSDNSKSVIITEGKGYFLRTN